MSGGEEEANKYKIIIFEKNMHPITIEELSKCPNCKLQFELPQMVSQRGMCNNCNTSLQIIVI